MPSSSRRRKRSVSNGSVQDRTRKDGEAGPCSGGEADEEGASKGNEEGASKGNEEGASKGNEEGASKGNEEGASKGNEEGASKGNEEGAGKYGGSTSTLRSFEKVLARGSIHTAECCRLSVPRAFCERYKVESDVTVTDSAGIRYWPMRFQSCGVWKPSRPSAYTISNGWREFSYDHSLKVNDRILFTLLSTSHFLVEFATAAMLPTSDGEDYPWKINRARLECLFNASDLDSSQIRLQEKLAVRKNIAPVITSEFRQSTAAPISLQEDDQGVIRIKTVARKGGDDEQEAIRKTEAPKEDAQRLIAASPITLHKDEHELIRPLAGRRRESPIYKQQLPKENLIQYFCQCDTAKLGNGTSTRRDTSWTEYVPPEFTHLECKNADGSSYLQIVDSDTEIT